MIDYSQLIVNKAALRLALMMRYLFGNEAISLARRQICASNSESERLAWADITAHLKLMRRANDNEVESLNG